MALILQRKQQLPILWVLALVICSGCVGRPHDLGDEKTTAGTVGSVHSLPRITDDAVATVPDTIDPKDLAQNAPSGYLIGRDDQLEISVYGETDLEKTQIVRPDGKIAFPLVGDIEVAGLTPDELREHLAQKLSKYIQSPRVNVIVTGFESRKIFVLGELEDPGAISIGSNVTLVEAVARAGGVKETADLAGALLVREGRILPVRFDDLFRRGDFSHNLTLQPLDVVLIPSTAMRKVFILGEVKQPLVASLRYDTTLIESITLAGGFTADAEKTSVILARGGLADPEVRRIDVRAVVRDGDFAQNVMLQPGDIVYVPRSYIADVELFCQRLATILRPIVLAETGIILGPNAWSVLSTGETDGTIGINIP